MDTERGDAERGNTEQGSTDRRTRHSGIRSLLLVAAVSLGAAALITGAWEISHDRILANERARLLANLSSVIDAPPGIEVIAAEITAPASDGNEYVSQLFAMIADGNVIALVFAAVAPNGYNGPIEFLLGMTPEGTIIRARVIRHRETPGLGDAIESEKSDWIDQFDGASLANPSHWAVAADGGPFDAITGATVTPRALVEAIQAILEYHAVHGKTLMPQEDP